VTEVVGARAAAQLLHRPGLATTPDLVRHLLAVQAQDLRAARLALRARASGLTAADVDEALASGALVVAWLLRGTLHLVAAEDYPWLLALTAPTRFATSRRRLGELGVSPEEADRAVAVIEAALAADGPLARAELAARLAAEDIRTEGQATPHLLGLAALRGVAVLGPPRGKGLAYVLAREWLPAPGSVAADRNAALAELARRYLAGHGPAAPADLAAWSGLALRDARAGLDAIASDLVERDDGLLDLTARGAAPEAIPPRLLPAFDPYLLGWKDRGFAVAPEHARQVHPGGGIVRATATVDGRAVGTWTAPGGEVRLDLFAPVRPADAAALQAEARDVTAFTSARPS
jgi:hypothetical protein